MGKDAPVTGFGVKTLDPDPIVPAPIVSPSWPPRVVPASPSVAPFASTPLVMITLVAISPAVLGEPLLEMNETDGAVGFEKLLSKISTIRVSVPFPEPLVMLRVSLAEEKPGPVFAMAVTMLTVKLPTLLKRPTKFPAPVGATRVCVDVDVPETELTSVTRTVKSACVGAGIPKTAAPAKAVPIRGRKFWKRNMRKVPFEGPVMILAAPTTIAGPVMSCPGLQCSGSLFGFPEPAPHR